MLNLFKRLQDEGDAIIPGFEFILLQSSALKQLDNWLNLLRMVESNGKQQLFQRLKII
jgi:hypothetical protein